MRILPASFYRNGRRMQNDGMPRPGGMLRKVFDFMREHKGKPVHNKALKDILGVSKLSDKSKIFTDLRDFYGCDIRSVPDCHHKCLAGEWFGDEYVDYIAQHLETTDH